MAVISGTRLGSYEVLTLLGAGGMGEVYRARDSQLQRDVAIKVLAGLSTDSDRLRRFEQEARAAAALNHPNILAVYQLGIHDGAPYLVSELLEGETLREQIRRGMPLRKAIDCAVQIARGLAAAHEKGIVHRDLKPENVFVTRDGRVKILDFGLAKLTQPEQSSPFGFSTLTAGTEPGVVLGTVGYMSPEQVRGERSDHRGDIFAFGAILYEMLTGKKAFQKQTSVDTMSAILNEDPPSVSQIMPTTPPALQRVVHRCLEKSPDRRFQSASDLAFALEALSDSGSELVGATLQKTEKKNWTWIAIAGLAIAIAAALVALQRVPPATPQLDAVTQLTDDGQPKHGHLVSDGSRVYFTEGATGSQRIAQVSVNGGQTALITSRLVNPQIVGLAPDGSALLAMVGGFNDPVYPLWSIPLPAGEARRLGDFLASDANFFPDGRLVVLQTTGLFIAERDGSAARKIASNWSGYAAVPSVSPDGKRVCVSTWSGIGSRSRLLEIGVDDGAQHDVLTVTPELASPGYANWTPDQNYLVFQNLGNGRSDLWVLPERTDFFKRARNPVRLTNGPVSYTDTVPSRDGKKIFAIGSQRRGELIRYEERFQQFVPYLSGISGTDPSFSRDGKWVAYRSYPDYALWRSRIDGTDRLQLTYPPTVVWLPTIAPDGTQVAYGTTDRVVYVSSINGGPPRKIAENSITASWSPDGKLLALTSFTPSGQNTGYTLKLQILELNSGTISSVPESEGKIGAFWVDQHTLVAANLETTRFLTFDLTTQKWSVLASGVFVNWFISPDNKYLYITTGGAEPRALRFRFADRRMETITSLSGLRRVVDPYFGTQVGVAPDGSVLLTRDVGTQEIYALDVKWP